MLVFFLPFFENLGSYVYDSMRVRTVLFACKLGKTAGDPHPSGPVSAPVFPVLAFLHVAGGLALFFALASPP